MVHVVHVLTRLLRGGAEENTVETCRWQVAQGYRVTLIHGAEWDPVWARDLPVGVRRVAVPEMVHAVHPLRDMQALRVLRGLYRQLRPDVVHTHQSKAGILGRLAADVVPGAVVVHGIHIVPFEGVRGARRAGYLAAERRAARRTDVFLSVTDAAGAAFLREGLARPGQVHTVRSGMDLTRFQRGRRPSDWRAMLGLADGVRRPAVLLMMAAMERRKGHVPFLEALAQADLPPFRLLLAGTGAEETRVRQTVARLGLSDRVRLLGHRSDPEALFALADVSVLTSAREGLPRVAVQSMAAGCPMVVQDLPAIGELIRDGDNGVVTPAGDMAATVGVLRRLLEAPERLDRLAEGARATDVSAWSLEALGARTTAFYGLPDQRSVAA